MKSLSRMPVMLLAYVLASFVWCVEVLHVKLFSFMHRSGMILAANSFSKEERVAFEDILEGFNDALVLSRNVAMFNTDQTMMERTNNTIWRPQPYIAQSFDGTDQTANFNDSTQLSVPATIGFNKSAPAFVGTA